MRPPGRITLTEPRARLIRVRLIGAHPIAGRPIAGRPITVRLIACALLTFVLALAGLQPAFADGGRVRFRRRAGPFVVTLFTTPDPLTKGRADFSVAVERAGAEGLVQDADVDLILTPAVGRGAPLQLHASHEAATSKWLQAANFVIPRPGLWNVTVRVRRGGEAGHCSGEVLVREARAGDLTWDVLPVPLLALFLAFHEFLKRKHHRELATLARGGGPDS